MISIVASLMRKAATVVCLCIMLSFGLTGNAAEPVKTEPLLTKAARTIGIRRCLPAISAVAERGTIGATLQDIVVDWDRQLPDNGPFYSLTAMGAGAQRAVLSVSAFPKGEAGCTILVERISAVSQPCADVAKSELKGFAATQLIDGIMVYQSPNQPDETYTLVSSDASCVIIRRQASLNWPRRP